MAACPHPPKQPPAAIGVIPDEAEGSLPLSSAVATPFRWLTGHRDSHRCLRFTHGAACAAPSVREGLDYLIASRYVHFLPVFVSFADE